MHDFSDLMKLSETDPVAYRAEVARMRAEEPDRFATFLEELRAEIEREGWSRPRRISSISALALGDVDALLAKLR